MGADAVGGSLPGLSEGAWSLLHDLWLRGVRAATGGVNDHSAAYDFTILERLDRLNGRAGELIEGLGKTVRDEAQPE